MRGDFIAVIVEIFSLKDKVNLLSLDLGVKLWSTLICFREPLFYLDVNLSAYNHPFYRSICARSLQLN